MKITQILASAALAAVAQSHATLWSLAVNGVDQGVGKNNGGYIRAPANNSPVKDINSKDMTCNNKNSPVAKTVSIASGDKVTFQWFHDNNNAGDDIIDGSHQGPVIVYIAPTSSNGAGNVWVKLAEEGYNPSTKKWAVDNLKANRGKHSVVIPASLAAGEYLLRAEIIAHHESDATFDKTPARGAQFYPNCAQIKITKGGATTLPVGVAFPGAYKYTDAGIHFNLYSSYSSYQIPGPKVWDGKSGGSAPGPIATTKAPVPATTKAPVVIRPTTKAPVVVRPTTKAPVVVRPTTKAPVVVKPTTKAPVVVRPTTKNPYVIPTTKAPVVVRPTTTKAPVVVRPTTKAPVVIRPTTTKAPVVIRPTTKAPVVIRPTTTKAPVVIRPTTKGPVVVRPTTTKAPVVIRPTTKGPVVVRPTTTKAPVVVKPTTTKGPVVVKPTTTKAPVVVKPTTTKKPVVIVPTTTKASVPTTTKAPVVVPTKMVCPGGPPKPVVTTAAKWGQCGGVSYKGPTKCVAGTTCKFSNQYYSQCL